MAPKKNDKTTRFVAIEICHSQLYCAIATKGEYGDINVQTKICQWRNDALTLNSETGPSELIAALKEFVQEFKLQGMQIHFSLNGDYCVTRVVTGTNEKVEEELENLEERSNLYLSLGHGKKALGGSVQAIDARNQHALLTVVNQQTLDVLVNASSELGFKLQIVEPSLVALSRFLNQLEADHDGPKLIVSLGEKGVEVGISQHGQLLLDYRPPGNAVNGRIAAVIVGHLGRLQRYCDRYVGFSKGKLQQAFLCGRPETVATVQGAFEQQSTFPLQIVSSDLTKLPWSFEGETPDSQFNAVLGVLLLHINPPTDQETPNLMERLNALLREPLLPALMRSSWPIAVALGIAILLEVLNFYQGWRCDTTKGALETAKADQAQAAQVWKDIESTQKKLGYMRVLSKRLSNPGWDEMTTMIGQCLPNDAWLESVSVDRNGQMTIVGGSLTQDGIYEFEKWLNTLPVLTRVSLGGTETVQTTAGPAITFHVRCEVVEYSATEVEKGKRNDSA